MEEIMRNIPRWMPPLACAALCMRPAPALAQNAPGGGMLQGHWHFETSASKVLTALARVANASIVVPDDIKTIVTVDMNNVSLEQAIKLVAAQAGVAYRRIDNTFVVAPVERMQKVLDLFGKEETVPLQNLPPASAVTQLKEAVPFLTARPAGHSVILKGAPEDIVKARAILQDLDVPSTEPLASASVTLTYAPATDIQSVLTTQFPALKAQKVGDNAVVFSGPRSEVQSAQDFIKALDRGKEANARYVVYQVKYSSARALTLTLRSAIQNLTVVPGPEPFYIPHAPINLSSATSLSGSELSGSGTSGTGSFGTGGGGFGGTSGIGGIGGGQAGSDIGSMAGGGYGGTGQGAAQLGERARTLIIGGTEENVKAGLKLLESIDVPTPQVVLDVKVISTTPQATQNLGIEWSQSVSTTFFERPNLPPGAAGNDFPAANTGSAADIRNGFGLGNFGRLPITFSATLNAFFQRQDVRILAKPTITALDNEDGAVFVGETRRVSVSSVLNNVSTNNVVLNNVVEIPVGIILQMRPRVNEGDMISLHVHPIYSTGGVPDPRTGLFSTFQREADTTVRIRSGETLVIGGLLQDEETKTFTKVPILGDIPLIGQLFRNHTTNHLRREVLVFVTPHLIRD
jgi:general secretion pathway protein D